MVEAISNPSADSHIAACGLFCSNCRKFLRGRCKGCQIEPDFGTCPVRLCCVERNITACAECPDFKSPRDYRECKKLNNIIATVYSFLFGSDRPGALALLRDEGLEKYLAVKRETYKM